MNKSYLLLILFFAGCYARPQEGYTVEGQLSRIKDDTIKLCKYFNGEVIDKTIAKNGSFVFKHKGHFTGDKVYLSGAGVQGRPFFYLEPGVIELTGSVSSVKAAGTPSNDANNAYAIEVAPLDRKVATLRSDWSKETDTSRKKQLQTEVGKALDSFYAFRRKFAYGHNNTILAAEFLSAGTGGLTYSDMKTLLSKLDPETPENWYTNRLKERCAILGKTDIGQVLPDFSLPDTSGNMVKFSSLRGNVVLVDFWASWCKPCREENQNVLKLYNRYNKSGFTVISVSIDEKRERWTKAIRQDKLPWYHVSSLTGWDCPVATSLGVAYGMSGVPYTLLVDRNGKVIGHNIRGEKLEEKLGVLFNSSATN